LLHCTEPRVHKLDDGGNPHHPPLLVLDLD